MDRFAIGFGLRLLCKSTMEGNYLMPGSFDCFLELQGSMPENSQQYQLPNPNFIEPQQIEGAFPFGVVDMQEFDQSVPFLNCNNQGDVVENFAGANDGKNVAEQCGDSHRESSGEEKDSPWKRVKWTDEMVKLLITAVSYAQEIASCDSNGNGRKTSLLLPKIGKWKAISMVMVERGCQVSPQQCEDKFYDLNKKYKKLNDMLGRGISCDVVENPALLDSIDLPDIEKENVRKILNTKQLFYKEMCSYHNENRLYLPHDRALQQSLQVALKGRNYSEYYGEKLYIPDNLGVTCILPGVPAKRNKLGEEDGAGSSLDTFNISEPDPYPPKDHAKMNNLGVEHGAGSSHNTFNGSEPYPPKDHANDNLVFKDSGEGQGLQNQWMMSGALQLQEQKLKIQARRLELEKKQFAWLSSSRRADRELDKMRLENEFLKLENAQLAFELKRRELGAYLD
ncbi:hypothetical protein RJ640_009091 [Escallonia rubra]|uniref:Myb/SANT-like DNA-binding domain-containing protein n=1 Tax=Escallonia rubra TaxID=112253 RepID=A0AA88RKD9_9ASTE|nr:hypothetical protein RJ640_009091 [Escallonia rubra]